MQKNKSEFLKSGDIAELMEWTRLIFADATLQQQIETGALPDEEAIKYLCGRRMREAEIYIGKKIIAALEAKVAEWKQTLEAMPEEEVKQQTS